MAVAMVDQKVEKMVGRKAAAMAGSMVAHWVGDLVDMSEFSKEAERAGKSAESSAKRTEHGSAECSAE